MRSRKTNEQIVMEIMRHSEYGALAQVFVMDALDKLSAAVAESKPEDYGAHCFVEPKSWIGVAREIRKKLRLYR